MKIKSLLRIINLPFKAFYKLLFPWKNLSKRNQKIVTITSIIVILIMIPVIYYTLSHLKGASAAWFNDNWGFRQIVAITNAGTAQTDFQVSITLDTATLITAGKMRSDCNDIRITDINGRLIPYWIEESPTTNACNSSTTKIWTKVPSIPTSGATLYTYYGNPSATSVKNGYKTFEQFDDFNRANSTTVGNDWLETDGAGSAEISSNQLKLSITNTTKNGVIAYKPYTASSAVAMEYSTKNTTLYRAAQGFFVSLSSWTNIYTQEYATLAPYSTVWINKNYYVSSARQEATITSATTDTTNFYRGKVEILGTTDNYSWSLPGTNNFTDTQASVDSFSNIQNYGFTVWNDNSASNLPVNYIDWFFIRKTATTPPSVAAPASEEKSPAPVAYWKFDEGTGSVAKDLSTNSFNGTLGGSTLPAWKPESECISGKCLFFDSSNTANNPKVTLNESSTTKTNILGDVTISLWFKPVTGYNTTSQAILRNGQGADLVYSVFYDPTNQRPYFHWYDGTFKQVNGTTNSAPLNKWTQVEIVRSGTALNFYVNGNLTNSETVTAPTVSASQLAIGQTNNDAVGQDYHGFIDDVKVYNYARSAAQVKSDYASRGSVKGVSAALGGNNETMKQLSNGLVGYWKMDEASATTTTTDSSGNGNTGSINLWGGGNTATSSARVTGKYGGSITFDGEDDNVSIGNGSSLNITGAITLSAWVYITAGQQDHAGIISGRNCNCAEDYALVMTGTGIRFNYYNGSAWYDQGYGSVPTNAWSLLTITRNASGSIINYFINGALVQSDTGIGPGGGVGSNTKVIGLDPYGTAGKFSGKIDEARIYNRDLSPAEVSQLYNFAPGPMGYWNFEEGSGNSVNDTSGNASTGTWNGTGTTHWSSGKYGKAGNFNGTDDYVSVGQMSISSDITVGAWVYSSNYNQYGFIVGKNLVNQEWELFFEGANLRWRGGSAENTVVCSLPANNQWHYIVGKQSGTTGELYVDGVSCDTGTLTAIGNGSGNVEIGRFNNAYYFNGKIDDVKVYNYLRTSAQIVSDMNGGHPNVGSPVGSAVGYWKMDEGYGSGTGAIHNSGNAGSALNGTSTSTTWSNNGKFGKALSFDGSSSYVNTGNSSILNLGASDFSVSTWIYPTSTAKKFFLEKSDLNDGWNLGLNNSGNNQIFLELRENGTTNNQILTYNSTIQANNWYYVTVVKSGANITVYKNGVSLGTQVGYQDLSNASANFYIGFLDWWGPSYFQGLIDEVKLYSYALTADEVKLDMNHGSSQVLGSLSDTSNLTGGTVASNSASAQYCIPGDTASCASPVGRWNFEEGQGTAANDISGNANTGTWNGTGNHWTSGKYGKGGNFALATSDYVSKSSPTNIPSGQGARTISAWIKPTNVNPGGVIFAQNNAAGSSQSFIVQIGNFSGTTYLFTDGINGTNNLTITGSEIPAVNQWNYISFVFDGSSTWTYYLNGVQKKTGTFAVTINTVMNNVEIGRRGDGANAGYNFPGAIDEARIYNYARTPAQIAYDYNRGAPVGYWKMDECQGGNAYDSSGNGKTGTITIGGTGSQTVLGTCTTASTAWGNGGTGKYNASLNFDGTDDVIDAGNNSIFNFTSGDFSISLWVKSADGAGNETLLQRGLTQVDGWTLMADPYVHLLTHQSGAYTYCRSQHPVIAGQWQHWVAVRQGSSVRLYKNGLEDIPYTAGTCISSISNPVTSTRSLTIGNGSWGYFNGQIDDTRIYNYALTKQQIQQVFNQGAGVRFGPQTGTP